MIAINGGAVPILEFTNGEILLESAIIAQWANDNSKISSNEESLIPKDPDQAAKLK